MNIYFYVGAYVSLPKSKITDTIDITRCPDKKCTNHNGYHAGTKFCPLCGSEIEKATLTNTTSRKIRLWDLEETFENFDAERFFSPQEGVNFNAVISNMSGSKTGYTSSDDDAGEGIKVLNETAITKMKEAFEKELKSQNFFTQFEKHYGVVPVVEFGSFSYYM